MVATKRVEIKTISKSKTIAQLLPSPLDIMHPRADETSDFVLISHMHAASIVL